VRFEFTDEQRTFQSTVRDFLAKECSPEEVRAAWDGDSGLSRTRWRGLAELGLTGVLLPEDAGGLGMDEVDLVLAIEETGRAALPDPIVDTAAVAAPLLAEAAEAEFRKRWLAPVAEGSAVFVIQKGGKPHIADAHVADLVVLVHDDEVHALTPSELTLEAQESVDGSRKLFSVDWHRTSDSLVASGERGWTAVNRGFDRGVLFTAAQQIGLADRMLDMTVDYVRERQQFGVAIGSFQAVKHRLTDVLLALEFARPLVYRAAYSLAEDAPTRSRDVSMAKAYAGKAARAAARAALQCHGAIGYTVEYDLHLFMKRAWALEATWGDTAWHRERVATAVLGAPPP
jgi:alkylation response protein AidB-like acyl-CoA dehydrogenase